MKKIDYTFFCFGAILVLLSYLVLLPIPVEESNFGYFLIAIATILFIIGAAMFSIAIPEANSKIGKIVQRIIYAIVGLAILALGIIMAAKRDFEFNGMAIFTVLLIEGLYVGAQAFSKTDDGEGELYATLDGFDIPVVELYEAFKDVDTPYGKPWIGVVSGTKDQSLIYGPMHNDCFLFAHYVLGKFTITASDQISYLVENEDLEAHRLPEDIGSKDYENGRNFNLMSWQYPKNYANMFEQYATTHDAVWTGPDFTKPMEEKIYAFDGKFSMISQKYNLIDEYGTCIYEISSSPLRKCFMIKDSNTKEVVFRITKRRFHFFPRYDFYYNKKKYGTMRQEAVLKRDVFSMKTADGYLELKEILLTIGVNYGVYMDHRIIGFISENLNLTIENVLLDNYAITVYDERYRALLTGMAIMVEREKIRDLASVN